MIITSPVSLEVGKVYTEKEYDNRPFELYHRTYWKYRFLVMREATLEEYRWEITREYADPDSIINREFFYEISMD